MAVQAKERVLYGAEARLASGRVHLVRMGAVLDRGDFADEQASPEALLAAAQATCYASSLSSLVEGPLTVRTVCVLERDPSGVGWRVSEVRVEVAAEGDVTEAMALADRMCPISKVISQAVPVVTTAR